VDTVSVIIPAQNAAPWIGDAIRSVAAQTHPASEIILIDNASIDETCAVIEEHQKYLPRITLLRNATDLGPAASRNRGIAHATGEWIAFLDADDWFAPTRLERLIEIGTRTGARIVADNQIFTYGPEETIIRTLVPQRGETLEWIGLEEFLRRDRIVDIGTLGLLKPIFRRRFIAETGLRFDEDPAICLGEDSLFYVSCLIANERILLTDEPLYFYRQRPGSLSRSVTIDGLRVIKEKQTKLLDGLCDHASPTLAAAIEERIADHDDLIAFRALVDAVRAGRYGRAAGHAWRNRVRARFFVEHLAQVLRYRLRETLSMRRTSPRAASPPQRNSEATVAEQSILS
jgi:succinoglycan biosynthesis protein ExoO